MNTEDEIISLKQDLAILRQTVTDVERKVDRIEIRMMERARKNAG